jgi:hypothetical protein
LLTNLEAERHVERLGHVTETRPECRFASRGHASDRTSCCAASHDSQPPASGRLSIAMSIGISARLKIPGQL